MDITIFVTTDYYYYHRRCARKIQILYIKQYGEVTGTLSSTIKTLLPQSPPTHRLMNTHHLCTKFNFINSGMKSEYTKKVPYYIKQCFVIIFFLLVN